MERHADYLISDRFGRPTGGRQNSWQRLRLFLTAPATAVLDGYHAQRAPITHWLRKSAIVTCIAALALVYGFFSAVLPSSLMVYLALPIVILSLLIVWLLPATDRAPTLLLRRLFFLYFGVMLLWPNYIAIVLGGLPWISLRRVVLVPIALTFLICLSVSPRFRGLLIQMRRANPYTWNLMVAFAIIQTLAIAMSDAIPASVNFYANNLVAWTGIFFISIYVFHDEKCVDRWVRMLLIFGIVLAFLGMVEYHVEHILWRDYIPFFLRAPDDSVQRTLTASFRDGRYRATMTFSGPLSFGEFLAVLTPFLIHAIVTAPRRLYQAALLAADLLFLCAIYATYARLGMVGWLVAHVLYVFFWALKRWQGGKLGMFAPAITMAYPVIAALIYVAVLTVPAIHNRVLGGGAAQYSNDVRHVQYMMARERWKSSPLLGYGPGRAPYAIGYVNLGGMPTVDSYMLSVSVDYGLAGLLVFTSLIFGTIFLLGRTTVLEERGRLTLMAPLAVALLVYVMIRMVLSQDDNCPLLYALLGLSSALLYHHKQRLDAPVAPPKTGNAPSLSAISRT